MVTYKSLGIYLCIWYIIDIQADAYLNLVSHSDVSAIYQKAAELLCKIESDKAVKEVIWYKLSESGPKKTVYYFEPPKYNGTSADYKGLVHLAPDNSSLVINSAGRENEGTYECHVAVMPNSISQIWEIPEESSAEIKLTVFVPPSDIKLSTFLAGNNLTFTCRSTKSIPTADIEWVVTRQGISKTVQSDKIVTDIKDSFADTIGYLYLSLTEQDQGTIVECVVSHPDTKTILKKNVTMVPPRLEHPVDMYFDWLGFNVPYSTFESTLTAVANSVAPSEGLVNMTVIPHRIIQPNTTVIIDVVSKGTFPQPSYTWWSEDDLSLKSGHLLTIRSLNQDRLVYCVVENPVGRVVMSVQLITSDSAGAVDPTSSGMNGEVIVSGALVAGIAFGGLIVLLLISFLIYYFAFRVPRGKETPEDGVEPDDFDSYVVKEKPPYSSQQPTGQTKVVTQDGASGMAGSTEKEALLKNAQDSPDSLHSLSGDSPVTNKKALNYSQQSDASSSTSTSGYEDDGGRNNDVGTSPRDEPDSDKNRAITKHLNDFDENASFVGDYGSSFGIDGVDNPEEEDYDSRRSSSDHDSSRSDVSDDESMDSGASGVEGRYTLPHRDSGSWEHIDPNQRVGKNGRPSAI